MVLESQEGLRIRRIPTHEDQATDSHKGLVKTWKQ